jgi:hypothetical protein
VSIAGVTGSSEKNSVRDGRFGGWKTEKGFVTTTALVLLMFISDFLSGLGQQIRPYTVCKGDCKAENRGCPCKEEVSIYFR